ncbi:hypothetical protein, partial [Pectobacterium quasiaquaticum]|uniref:hypothetical protein n=1 Tax=Pectobacterium quasiaquaticum TaxID=2774015 RepID=UPI001CF7A3A7
MLNDVRPATIVAENAFVWCWPGGIYRRSADADQGKRCAMDGAPLALHRPAALKRASYFFGLSACGVVSGLRFFLRRGFGFRSAGWVFSCTCFR